MPAGCWRRQTDAPLLLFLDADVRLVPDAVARVWRRCRRAGWRCCRGFRGRSLGGWMEWMLLPLIHFVLLGFLPMGRMRKTTKGVCGGVRAVHLAEREAYFACGGHAAIRETRHDGLRLPRVSASMDFGRILWT